MYTSTLKENLYLPGEQWKDIPKFEGLFQISNLGRIKRLSRQGKMGFLKEMILAPTWRGGKLTIILQNDNIMSCYYVHLLVARQFLPNPDGRRYVKFKNDDFNNVSVENLEWRKATLRPRKKKEEGKFFDIEKYSRPDLTGEQMLREVMAI